MATTSTSDQNSTNNLTGTRIGKKFSIEEKIGNGSFGDIFRGTDLATGERVAIKIERTSKRAILRNEAKLLNYLTKMSSPGIPRLRWYGMMSKYNIMVTDLLGKSLEKLFVECNHQFSLKTVLMLADQMIKRLEYTHNRNIIHRDIKPDNFLMGLGRAANHVYLIDFGLSKVYKHRGLHIPFRDGKSLTGTLRYASVFTHMGYEQSRRDDLECLGYVLIYFLKGNLPWQGMRAKTKEEKYRKVADLKNNTPIEALCSGLPGEFVQYVKYCRSLGFQDRPDYKYLRKLFQKLFKTRNYTRDYIYDWTQGDEHLGADSGMSISSGGSHDEQPQQTTTQNNELSGLPQHPRDLNRMLDQNETGMPPPRKSRTTKKQSSTNHSTSMEDR